MPSKRTATAEKTDIKENIIPPFLENNNEQSSLKTVPPSSPFIGKIFKSPTKNETAAKTANEYNELNK